nr:hypothetical protein Iba_chr12fCG8180 [Ipomoea batatas]
MTTKLVARINITPPKTENRMTFDLILFPATPEQRVVLLWSIRHLPPL